MLPEADWYLSTWDITQRPYSPEATSSEHEISNIKHLFRTVLVSNYKTEYLDTSFEAYDRPFILLEKVYNLIKDQGYERIIYFRPDLMLYALDIDNFDIDNKTIKILDCHGPEFWIDHERKIMQDSFLVFSWNNFRLFLNNRAKLCKYSIHDTLYKFISNHQIEVIPLYNMRSVIVRENAYANKNNLSWENLTTLFGETFIKYDQIGKFPKKIELIKVLRTDYELLELLERSKAQDGILKLRKTK